MHLDRTMSFVLHPAIAAVTSVVLLVSYLYAGYWLMSLYDVGKFDVPMVLAGLLEAESSAVPRPGAGVAVAFGGCRDRLASSTEVMHQLGAECSDNPDNVHELNDVAAFEKAFAYYFRSGASAGFVYSYSLTRHLQILFLKLLLVQKTGDIEGHEMQMQDNFKVKKISRKYLHEHYL